MKGRSVADTQRTLVIIKPDGVQRGLIGEIITRLERRGLRLVGLNIGVISEATAKKHYAEHEGKGFYNSLVSYITSGPSVTMVLEGPDAIGVVRSTVGSTRPAEAAPGTIRADYGLTVGRNLIHASDGEASAEREVALFFGDAPLPTYTRDIDRWILED
ncbi:MAG: nucleoside-diphosphate kinase [Thermomicrobiales bacterium]|jgi:nucleoside-diphosphate kinase|nr:nucleoside-diphosphate kinase [Thermomicrobiales bacterium]